MTTIKYHDKKFPVTITIRITEKLYLKLKREATKRKTTPSELIRTFIEAL